jgi:hypothetical protein
MLWMFRIADRRLLIADPPDRVDVTPHPAFRSSAISHPIPDQSLLKSVSTKL